MDETPQGFGNDVKGTLEDNEDGQLTPLYQSGWLWEGSHVAIVHSASRASCQYYTPYSLSCVGNSLISSAFAQAYPNTVDKIFDQHWSVL